ncbi:hypothetical protein HanIR_Chr11g0547101 [Helianthus annuus]|nr:hypothetical protein HanIR_Chr11g0547101 [Helianthus annuus]
MRSIRMIHVCLFAWSIRMIQHTTWRIVVKDYVFCFSDYVAFIVFKKLELVIVSFFAWFGKHYGTCNLLNIK